MGFFDVLLTGLALSMDACAVSMTNGMTDSKMPFRCALLIGLFFGVFQFLMPVIGYFITNLIAGAFQEIFEKIASWVAFALLAFLGGKMILDCILDYRKDKAKDKACVCEETPENACEKLSVFKLFTQAIATSIDALAIGITFRATAVNGGLAMGVWLSAGLIGVITLLLSVGAVYIGKVVGNRLADKATLCGGVVLIILAIKMLFI